MHNICNDCVSRRGAYYVVCQVKCTEVRNTIIDFQKKKKMLAVRALLSGAAPLTIPRQMRRVEAGFPLFLRHYQVDTTHGVLELKSKSYLILGLTSVVQYACMYGHHI